ncbi:MAG TPA: hypothetical protein VGA81_03175 [Methylomirabilota bacterium]
MKGLGLGLVVGGWMIAVGGLLATEVMMVRLGVALAGLATSLAGITALNSAHMETAPWKARGH